MVRLVPVFKTFFKALVSALVALSLSSGALVVADPSATERQERMREESAQRNALRERISKAEKKASKLKAAETSVIQELEQLNLQLHKSRARQRQINSRIEGLEGQMETLKADHRVLVAEIEALQTFAIDRLKAFYKLSQLGIAPVLFSAESISGFWQRREALERILEHDAELWDELQDQKKQLEAVSQELRAQKLNLDRLLVKRREEATRIAEEKADRAKLLARIRADRDLTAASIASLKEASKRLDETIRSLQQELRPSSPGIASRPNLFAELKGSLPMPARGEIIGLFGPYVDKRDYHIKNFRSGVNINVDLDTPVRAVCEGTVAYAGWFKGYGNIMILDHGDHYYTLSAPLDQLLRKKGDAVVAGDVIGTYGDVATLSGPGLHFEIRHHGKPLDPVLWFKN